MKQTTKRRIHSSNPKWIRIPQFLLKTDWSLVDKHWALTWQRKPQSNWMNYTQHCSQLFLWSHLRNDETNISLTPLGTSLKGQVPTTTHIIMPSAFADVTFQTIKRRLLHNFSPTDTILKVLYAQCPPFPSLIQQESAEVSFKPESADRTVNVTQLRNWTLNWQGSEQIPADTYPWRRDIVQRRLTFVDPQHGPCFISPFWRLQFCDGSWFFF